MFRVRESIIADVERGAFQKCLRSHRTNAINLIKPQWQIVMCRLVFRIEDVVAVSGLTELKCEWGWYRNNRTRRICSALPSLSRSLVWLVRSGQASMQSLSQTQTVNSNDDHQTHGTCTTTTDVGKWSWRVGCLLIIRRYSWEHSLQFTFYKK